MESQNDKKGQQRERQIHKKIEFDNRVTKGWTKKRQKGQQKTQEKE